MRYNTVMKIAHLADLHLGKSVNGFSMIEDQRYILNQILNLLAQEAVTTVMIAGDVYDKAVPSGEAVKLLDWFLASLVEKKIEVMMIAGNHDSGDRLSFGSSLFENMHIHIVGNYEGSIPHYVMNDGYGPLYFYLCPFIRPITVNRYIADEKEKVGDYTQAMQYVIQKENIDFTQRNMILSHQFVTGAQVDENGSEELVVGGLDQISSEVYDGFDYVCLGHIHRPQTIQKDTIRYSGTPLKYSLSESNQIKVLPIIDFKEKGNIEIKEIQLTPLYDMKHIKGKFLDIMNQPKDEQYIYVTLTDEEDIPDAIRDLRQLFPRIMKLDYDNTRTRNLYMNTTVDNLPQQSPYEVFTTFYKERTKQELTEKQQQIIQDLMQEVWEDEQ